MKQYLTILTKQGIQTHNNDLFLGCLATYDLLTFLVYNILYEFLNPKFDTHPIITYGWIDIWKNIVCF